MINDKNYIIGDQTVQVPAHLNYGKFMLNQLRKMKDEIVLVNAKTRETISYKEFTQYAVDLAYALHRVGVRKGDTVALAAEIRNDFIGTVLSIIFTGATFTPIEFQCGRATLLHKTSVAKPKFLISSAAFWDDYKDTLKTIESIKTIIFMDDGPDLTLTISSIMTESVDINLFEPVQVQGQTDVACVLYSSGTTGASKGIMLTHLNCILNSNPDDFKDESLQVALILGSWYHNYDIFTTFRFVTSGKTVVFNPERTIENMIKDINDFKVNILFTIPSWIGYLSKYEVPDKYDLSSLKVLYSRSSLLHSMIVNRVKEKFPTVDRIIQGYGMTEAGEPASEIWVKKGPRPGSVGMPSPSVTLKVADLDSRKVLGPNKHGEICVRSPMLMKGYIGIDPDTYMDDEGFFKTGDLGYYDEDHYFFIVDRIHDVILFEGFKIAPLELETILLMHPSVREVGVVGKPINDGNDYEVPAAFVVKQPDSIVSEEELVKFVAVEVPSYMQLKGGVKFIDELPKNARQKVLRRRLRDMLLE